MFGIYIHIPFCRRFCYYCNFYKSANFKYVDAFMQALLKEIGIDKTDELEEACLGSFSSYRGRVRTIYLGGGSPSVLSVNQIESIVKAINHFYSTGDLKEMTIEINPEDGNLDYYQSLKDLGFNRLSIGIQSFNDKILHLLHRNHNVKQALLSVENAKKAGFDNISIDLIYGIPGQSLDQFENDLHVFFDLQLQHLSAYHLSIEEYTEFWRKKKRGLIREIPDELSQRFYLLLIDKMREAGYEHYEISNFALPAYRSRHNSAYWLDFPYLGFGPSAHSYDGHSKRFYNINSVQEYITNVLNDIPFDKTEYLSVFNKYNEAVINSLRTVEGFSFEKFLKNPDTEIDIFSKKELEIIENHYDDTIAELKKSSAKAFRSFYPYLRLKEEYFLTTDFYLDKLIIAPDAGF